MPSSSSPAAGAMKPCVLPSLPAVPAPVEADDFCSDLALAAVAAATAAAPEELLPESLVLGSGHGLGSAAGLALPRQPGATVSTSTMYCLAAAALPSEPRFFQESLRKAIVQHCVTDTQA